MALDAWGNEYDDSVNPQFNNQSTPYNSNFGSNNNSNPLAINPAGPAGYTALDIEQLKIAAQLHHDDVALQVAKINNAPSGGSGSSGGTNWSSVLSGLSADISKASSLYNAVGSSGGGSSGAGSAADPNVITAYQQATLNQHQADQAQQAAQFAASQGGQPIDYAKLALAQQAQDYSQYLSGQQLNLSSSAQQLQAMLGIGGLDLQQQQQAFNQWAATQNLGLSASSQALQGYQISSNVDIANKQLALSQYLGQGDQQQGWAKLALASQAQDLANFAGQANIDIAYQRLAQDAQTVGMQNAIAQQKMTLDAALGSAQAAAAMANADASKQHAVAAAAQAQAALRGVEVQLQLGNGNLELGKAQLAQANQLGLAQIDLAREQLGEKTAMDQATIAQQRYAVDAGEQGANYRAELNSATTREQTAAQAQQAKLNLIASLRGPRDYFQYLKVLRGANDQGLPGGGITALGQSGQEVAGFQAPSGSPEAVSLQSFLTDTGQHLPSVGQVAFPTRPGPLGAPATAPFQNHFAAPPGITTPGAGPAGAPASAPAPSPPPTQPPAKILSPQDLAQEQQLLNYWTQNGNDPGSGLKEAMQRDVDATLRANGQPVPTPQPTPSPVAPGGGTSAPVSQPGANTPPPQDTPEAAIAWGQSQQQPGQNGQLSPVTMIMAGLQQGQRQGNQAQVAASTQQIQQMYQRSVIDPYYQAAQQQQGGGFTPPGPAAGPPAPYQIQPYQPYQASAPHPAAGGGFVPPAGITSTPWSPYQVQAYTPSTPAPAATPAGGATSPTTAGQTTTPGASAPPAGSTLPLAPGQGYTGFAINPNEQVPSGHWFNGSQGMVWMVGAPYSNVENEPPPPKATDSFNVTYQSGETGAWAPHETQYIGAGEPPAGWVRQTKSTVSPGMIYSNSNPAMINQQNHSIAQKAAGDALFAAQYNYNQAQAASSQTQMHGSHDATSKGTPAGASSYSQPAANTPRPAGGTAPQGPGQGAPPYDPRMNSANNVSGVLPSTSTPPSTPEPWQTPIQTQGGQLPWAQPGAQGYYDQNNDWVPSYSGGISNVPYDQLALIHQGEQVVTADQNPNNPNAWMSRFPGMADRLQGLTPELLARLNAFGQQQSQLPPQQQPGFTPPSPSPTDLNSMTDPTALSGNIAQGVPPVTATMPAGLPAGTPPHALPVSTPDSIAQMQADIAPAPSEPPEQNLANYHVDPWDQTRYPGGMTGDQWNVYQHDNIAPAYRKYVGTYTPPVTPVVQPPVTTPPVGGGPVPPVTPGPPPVTNPTNGFPPPQPLPTPVPQPTPITQPVVTPSSPGITPSDQMILSLLGTLPNSPHEIPLRKFMKLLPSEKDLVLAAIEAKGYAIPDVQELINRTAPGGVAASGNYAAVGR